METREHTTAVSEHLGSYTVDDGYNGREATAQLVYWQDAGASVGHLFEVYPHGWHGAGRLYGSNAFASVTEAEYYLRHHSSYR